MSSESEFEGKVAERLKEAGISFDRNAAFGGVRPDFLIHGPQDQVIILEAKSGSKRPGFTKDAAEQARLYKHKIGADDALVVIDRLERSTPSKGVVTVERLVDVLRSSLEKAPTKKKKKARPGVKVEKATIFVAMPFAPEYEDVFFGPIAAAADSVGGVASRVDQEEFSGDIVEEVRRRIRGCTATIIDLSESRPNVLYEAGFAHALGKPALLQKL